MVLMRVERKVQMSAYDKKKKKYLTRFGDKEKRETL